MAATCIITDNSVQFAKHTFPGRNLIYQVPFRVKVDGEFVGNDPLYKVSSLPTRIQPDQSPELIAPTIDECAAAIAHYGETYSNIVAILMSSKLTKAYQNLEMAAKTHRGKVSLSVIDSQTTSIGLGALVQLAAENAAKGSSIAEIELKIRGKIPKIYSQFCLSNLSYLSKGEIISKSQSMLGEMLGILPIFAFEEGRLVSSEKVKNYRLLVENFREFVDEFSDLDQVALVQSQPPLLHEAHGLREHVNTSFTGTPFIELPINLPLAALLGPSAVGVFAIEA